MSYQGVGRHVSMMFPFCQTTKNRIQGRVRDRIGDIGVLLGRAVFLAVHDGPADRIELIPPERFCFVHCKKHSDVFRTRQKKQREVQQLIQQSVRFASFVSLNPIPLCIKNPVTAHLWPVSNPTIFPLGLSAPP